MPWLDVGPTNGRPDSSDLTTLAWERDYGCVSPPQGVSIGGNQQKFEVMVDVEG